MFEGLKKLWQEAKKGAEEAQEFAKDDGVIKMPPAVFGHEHETMPVDLSPKLLLRKSTLLNTKVNLERIIAKINSLDVDERKEWEQLKVASIRLIYQVDIIINQPEECPPPSIGNEQGTPIDKEIAALVGEMNRVGIHTTCSCQGNVGQDGAYISIHVGEGTTYDYRDDTKELTLRWRRG